MKKNVNIKGYWPTKWVSIVNEAEYFDSFNIHCKLGIDGPLPSYIKVTIIFLLF